MKCVASTPEEQLINAYELGMRFPEEIHKQPSSPVLSEENDRLTYLGASEVTKDGRPKVDELVLTNASIHLESLSDQCFMLIADNHKHHWHLSICTDSNRSKLHAVVQEEENK